VLYVAVHDRVQSLVELSPLLIVIMSVRAVPRFGELIEIVTKLA